MPPRTLTIAVCLSWTATAAAAFIAAVPGRAHLTLLAASVTMSLWAVASVVSAHIQAVINNVSEHALAYDRGYTVAARAVVQGLLDGAERNAQKRALSEIIY